MPGNGFTPPKHFAIQTAGKVARGFSLESHPSSGFRHSVDESEQGEVLLGILEALWGVSATPGPIVCRLTSLAWGTDCRLDVSVATFRERHERFRPDFGRLPFVGNGRFSGSEGVVRRPASRAFRRTREIGNRSFPADSVAVQ